MSPLSELDSSGGILTGDFARFVAEEQKAEAFTLKQQRLFADETTQASKQQKGGGRGAAFITVDSEGGNIDEVVDDVIGNDVALPSFF